MAQSAAAISRRSVASSPKSRAGVPPRPSARRNPAREDERCRHLFNAVLVVMMAISIFALGRVALSAHAAATAIEAGRLNSEIKAQRLVGDLLECDKSALTTPSRIECIANGSLQMAEAPQVSYLRLPTGETAAAASATSDADVISSADSSTTRVAVVDAGGAAANLAGMLASVMEMAAGEAEVLLVGDAGLTSTR